MLIIKTKTMKQFINKIFILLLVGLATSCSEDILREYDKLQQKDAVESVNDPFLLSSIIKKTTLFYQEQAYSTTKLPGSVQYIVRNYQGSDNTYSGFKSPTTEMYSAMDILKLVDASVQLAEDRKSDTHKGIFMTIRVLLFSYMTDFYGDVYYTEALKGREGILYPKYDKQADIYTGLLDELKTANTLISTGTETVSSAYDLMYGGDKTKWLKFNNSLRIRLLMRASKKIPTAGSEIAAIIGNPAATPVLADNADNAAIGYIGTTADNSWKGGNLNWVTSDEFDKRRPSKTLVDLLATLNDPRLPVWCAPIEKPWTDNSAMNGVTFETTDPNGFKYTSVWEFINLAEPAIAAQAANILDKNKVYAGWISGMAPDYKNGNGHYETQAGGVVGNFKVSKFSQLLRQNKHNLLKATIMNSDELQFILAEAVVKGMITGNADTYYRTGITLSMKRWGVSDANIATYLAQTSIALPADNAGKLDKIATQKWLALFLVSTEAYLDLRRTRLPDIFNNGNLKNYVFPSRFRYPGNELGQNRDAYDAGVKTLSPAVDDEFSKMWILQ
jgi:hypothetical protein